MPRHLSDISGAVLRPGDDGYAQATSPLNSTAQQHPGIVVVANNAADVSSAVRHARCHGLRVAVQATGHGAAGVLDDGILLIDTRRLRRIEVDRDRRVMRCGSGTVWGEVAKATAPLGLAGLSGTSPDVGVCGYTFNGGWGWLTRRFGLASARLRGVSYVDADGAHREADDGALWAFRGGGGLGIATAIEFELVPVETVWAGFRLWPSEQIDDLVSAWTAALDDLPPTVTTMVLQLKMAPPAPGVPDAIRGQPVAHLGLCSTDLIAGPRIADALTAKLPAPVADTMRERDLTELAPLHLDPTAAVPAHGDGFFLTLTTARAHAIFKAAAVMPDGPINEIELRHYAAADDVPGADGALTASPAPFLLHATGSGASQAAREAANQHLTAVREAADANGSTVSAHGFRDGQTDAPNALPPDVRERLAELRARDGASELFVVPRTHH